MKFLRWMSLVGALFAAHSAAAYPDKPIKIIVGFTPGAVADSSARLVAEKLQEVLKQPVIVENKTGAGGMIAADLVLASPPDGYTLMLATSGMLSVLPAIRNDLSFKVPGDLTLVARLVSSSVFLVARNGLPVNNVRELIAYAKANPGKVTYSSPGTGTVNHVALANIADMAGIQIERIPFRGDPESIAAIVAEQVDIGLISIPPAITQIRAGKVKALAISTPERSPIAPDVPTIRESGVDTEAVTWVGIAGPRGMSPEVVLKLNQAINGVLSDEALQKRFLALGLIAAPDTPANFKAYIEKELARWKLVAERLKITID